MEAQPESTETTTNDDDMPSYREMFEEWVAGEPWTKAHTPLVFHLRKLCRTLDAQISEKAEATGPANTAYLQALTRLEAKRPGGPGEAPQVPGQTDIFSEGFA